MVFCIGFTGIALGQQPLWESTQGPFGGSSVYAAHTASDGTLYLGTYSNGVYKSMDQGKTWTQIHQNGVFDLMVTSTGRIILGTDEIKWSDDGGDTWSYESTFYGIASLSQNSNLLAAGGDDGRIHFSDDDGTSWISTNPFHNSDDSPWVWDLVVRADQTILAATSNGVYTTVWPDTVWNATTVEVSVKSLVVTDQEIFAATSFEGLKKSTDNGASWQTVTSYPLDETEHLIQTDNGDLYAAALDTMFYSSDGGTTWEGIPMKGLPRPDFRALTSDQDGHIIAGIYESGAFRYDPANEMWELIGPPSTRINDIFETDDGRLLVGTESSGLHIYDIAQQTWHQAPKPFRPHYANWLVLPNITFVGQGSNDNLYMGVNKEIYTSSDNGISWTRQDSGYTVDNFADLTATTWTHSESKGTFIGTQSAGIYHSTEGAHWTPVNDSLPMGRNYYTINALEVGADGEIYAGGAWNGLKRWDTGNSAWLQVTATAEGVLENRVHSIARHPNEALFAGNHVLRSNTSGWEVLEIPSRFNYTVETIGITPGGAVFVTTNREETFRSDDTGQTWTNVTEGLPDIEIRDFAGSGNKIFAATVGLGLYQMENTSTSLAGQPEQNPGQIKLYENYPNPFNPTTTIRYSLSVAQQVSLKIYDTLGREVATLFEGRQSAGSHTTTFEAGNLSSGLYFYRIEGESSFQLRKMMLLK